MLMLMHMHMHMHMFKLSIPHLSITVLAMAANAVVRETHHERGTCMVGQSPGVPRVVGPAGDPTANAILSHFHDPK